jgi:tetratricopeptide (TPR) repeat protein
LKNDINLFTIYISNVINELTSADFADPETGDFLVRVINLIQGNDKPGLSLSLCKLLNKKESLDSFEISLKITKVVSSYSCNNSINAELMYNKAYALKGLGRYQEALKLCMDGLEMNISSKINIHFNLLISNTYNAIALNYQLPEYYTFVKSYALDGLKLQSETTPFLTKMRLTLLYFRAQVRLEEFQAALDTYEKIVPYISRFPQKLSELFIKEHLFLISSIAAKN